MNDAYSTFWYRPAWQQSLPIIILAMLFSVSYYQIYWQEIHQQIIEIKSKSSEIDTQLHQNESIIHKLPSLISLEQKITQLNQQLATPNQNQQQFIIHIQHVIDNSYVKLNRLQPSINSDTQERIYTIEIQGTYPEIYKCIQSIILSSPNPKGLLSSVNFQPQHGYLTATLTISFIKDDITHEK